MLTDHPTDKYHSGSEGHYQATRFSIPDSDPSLLTVLLATMDTERVITFLKAGRLNSIIAHITKGKPTRYPHHSTHHLYLEMGAWNEVFLSPIYRASTVIIWTLVGHYIRTIHSTYP
jgi:hypothetical protein